jgi:molecular chaperone GrpE
MDKKEHKEAEPIQDDNHDATQSDGTDVQIENLKAQLARALADYANLQKRNDEEKKMYFELATVNLLTKFFPLLSNLEKAFEATKDPGVGLVLKQFTDLLTSEGLKEIDSNGDFDPHFHEAVTSEARDEDGKVLKVLEKGYTLNGKVVKAAKVVVSHKGESQES